MSAVDNIEIQLEADAKQASSQLDKVIEKLGSLKNSLSGINTQKLKKEMQSFEDFQKQLQGLGQNVKVSGSIDGLKKQIEQAEARLDALLKKENKLQTVGGVDQNSKSFRSLQYDIAEVCGQLDILYAKMESLNLKRPLNFWEKPGWESRVAQSDADSQEPQSLLKYAADNVKQSFADIQEAVAPVSDSVRNIRVEMRKVGTETDSTRQKMEGMGNGGGLAGLMDQLRSISASDVFGRISAEIRDFQTRLGTRVPTEQYIELAANIQQAETELQRLLDKQDRMEAQGVSTSSASWKGLQYDIRVASDRVADFNRDMEQLRASGGDSQQLSALSYAFKGVANAAKNALSAVRSAGSGLKSFVTKVKDVTGSMLSAGHGMSRFNTHTVSVSKSLFKVCNMLKLMLTRLALRAVINNVGEGFKQLARESTEFNVQISSLMASCKQLAYSISALAAPIVNLLGPALNYIIETLTRAVNVVNQFLSALGGKSVFNKAKKQSFDYAASLDKIGSSAKKMAKEIRDATIGIDELNIISRNDTEEDEAAGEGGSGTGGDYYDTVPIDENIKSLADRIREILKTDDWSEIGRMIAAKLNEAMAAIPWEKIQAEAQRIAKGIGTFINGFVDELNWSLLGYTIGQGINTAVIFANTLLETIDFEKIGQSLATALNSAINTINWPALGKVFSNGLNAIINAGYGFVTTFDFGKLGDSIGTAVSTAIGGIQWEKGGATIGKAVTGLFETLNSFIKKTDFKALGKGIVDAIGGFFKNVNWGTIGNTLSSAISALLNFLTGIVQEIDWAGIPGYILQSIQDFFTNFDWQGVSKSLGELLGAAVKGAVELAGSIWDMLKEAWGNLNSYFEEYINEAGGNIVEGIFNGIVDAIKNVGSWIKENLFGPFIDGFKEAFGIHSPSKEMMTMGGYIVDGFLEGIAGKLSDCLSGVKDWASKIKEWFSGNSAGGVNSTTWTTYADNVISGFREKIGSAYTTVRTNITTWASDIKSYFTDNGKGAINNTTWTTYAGNIISGFKNKIGSSYTDTRANITIWASSIKTWFEEKCSSSTFYSVASDVIEGFKNGIGALYHTCRDNISKWGSSIIDWFKEKLDVNSPSRVFEQIGNFVVLGFNKAISESGKSTKGVVQSWADSFSDVDVGFKVGVDTSALRNYQNNYGADFANNAITSKIRQEISAVGRTTIKNDSSYMGELFRQAIKEELQPILSAMAGDMKRQADKEEQTNVYIGNREITDAVEIQQSANGFRFRPT